MRWNAKTSQAQREAVQRYDSDNTTRIALKLNNSTDKDILDWLNSVKNKQGYIKALIRADISSQLLFLDSESDALT